jgi:hypothetical protein
MNWKNNVAGVLEDGTTVLKRVVTYVECDNVVVFDCEMQWYDNSLGRKKICP